MNNVFRRLHGLALRNPECSLGNGNCKIINLYAIKLRELNLNRIIVYISDFPIKLIKFSNDIVTKNSIIECKSVNREVEDWYFESSLLQCAVYSALLRKTDGKLVTAKFFADMGNPIVETKVKPNIDYKLRFGDTLYCVEVNDEDKIVDFIIKKAKHCNTWDEAKIFDAQYKQKEFETLKDFFNYKLYE